MASFPPLSSTVKYSSSSTRLSSSTLICMQGLLVALSRLNVGEIAVMMLKSSGAVYNHREVMACITESPIIMVWCLCIAYWLLSLQWK